MGRCRWKCWKRRWMHGRLMLNDGKPLRGGCGWGDGRDFCQEVVPGGSEALVGSSRLAGVRLWRGGRGWGDGRNFCQEVVPAAVRETFARRSRLAGVRLWRGGRGWGPGGNFCREVVPAAVRLLPGGRACGTSLFTDANGLRFAPPRCARRGCAAELCSAWSQES